MKVGFNLLLWTTHVTEDRFHLIEEMKKTGYDGVEIPLFEGDPEHFRKLGKVIADNGLGATTVTVMPDTAHDAVSLDKAARDGARAHLEWAVDCTEALGGELVAGPIHQALGHFTGSGRTEEEWQNGVDVLRDVADHAARAGIALSVEPLNRFECYFLNLVEDAARFVHAIDRPNVGVLYDTFHCNIEEKHPIGALRHNMADINHVHISANDRGTPGKDHIPWVYTFETLKENGYDGWLTIEAFGRALPDLAAATRVWRDFFPEPKEVYTFGHDFIRNSWGAV
ncbi:MAG: sugar phosphate isomerase/epimerase [Geminicoccaceae bacterium]|nr:sugar phosphate isomerase/epimerase [Geminicoccaceae bacterium]